MPRALKNEFPSNGKRGCCPGRTTARQRGEQCPPPVPIPQAVDLDDGFRMMMNIVNTPHDAISIGMPVRITFEERDGQKLPQAEGIAY